MSKSVYVVVEVTYDYYRFQNNVYASTDYKNCYNWIKANRPNWQLVTNKVDRQINEDRTEQSHIIIEEHEVRNEY